MMNFPSKSEKCPYLVILASGNTHKVTGMKQWKADSFVVKIPLRNKKESYICQHASHYYKNFVDGNGEWGNM